MQRGTRLNKQSIRSATRILWVDLYMFAKYVSSIG